MDRRLLFTIAAFAVKSLSSGIASSSGVDYSSVAIGGGGYVTAILSTPPDAVGPSHVFFRTDVGASYRMDNSTGTLRWAPLLDALTVEDRNWYGGDAMALSARNSSRLWISAGAYLEVGELPVGILASSDAGESWRLLTPKDWGVRGASNDSPFRGDGERLAVHPTREDILLYGSYLSGIWRTTDASAARPTWTQVPCATVPCSAAGPGIGALSIVFDPHSAGNGSAVYAAVPGNASAGAGIYFSDDAGASWVRMPGSPLFAQRLVVAPPSGSSPISSVVWAAAQDGVWSARPCSEPAAVSAYCWTRATPLPLPDGVPYSGLAVNPRDGDDVIAQGIGSSSATCGFVRTRDGGATWALVGHEYLWLQQLPWWPASFASNDTIVDFCFGMGGGTVAFAPAATSDPAAQQLFVGNSWDVWLSTNWGASNATSSAPDAPLPNFRQEALGHEEVFVLSLAAPHAGPALLTGTADLLGFVHDSVDLAEYPRNPFFGFATAPQPYWGGEGVGVDYTEALVGGAPARIAVAHTGNAAGQVLVSDDGSRTWAFTAFAYVPGSPAPAGIAMAAWDADTMLVLAQNDVPWGSVDGGATWARASGLPPFPYSPFSGNRYNMSRPLVANRPLAPAPAAAAPAFYYAHCEGGALYRSGPPHRGPLDFERLATAFPPSPRCDFAAHPASTAGGLFWLAIDAGGLFFFDDSDSSAALSRITTVAVAHNVAIGAPPPASIEPAVYIFGLVTGAGGPWRPFGSMDRGKTWVDLGSSNGKGLGNWPSVMAASRQAFGLIVIGSFGRGAFWSNASAALIASAAAHNRETLA